MMELNVNHGHMQFSAAAIILFHVILRYLLLRQGHHLVCQICCGRWNYDLCSIVDIHYNRKLAQTYVE